LLELPLYCCEVLRLSLELPLMCRVAFSVLIFWTCCVMLRLFVRLICVMLRHLMPLVLWAAFGTCVVLIGLICVMLSIVAGVVAGAVEACSKTIWYHREIPKLKNKIAAESK